eukprot:690182-Prorocentrum_minimum.AAC.3
MVRDAAAGWDHIVPSIVQLGTLLLACGAASASASAYGAPSPPFAASTSGLGSRAPSAPWAEGGRGDRAPAAPSARTANLGLALLREAFVVSESESERVSVHNNETFASFSFFSARGSRSRALRKRSAELEALGSNSPETPAACTLAPSTSVAARPNICARMAEHTTPVACGGSSDEARSRRRRTADKVTGMTGCPQAHKTLKPLKP